MSSWGVAMRVVFLLIMSLLWGCSSLHGTSSSSYPSSRPAPVEKTIGVEVVFTEDEVRIIRAYYQTHGSKYGKGKHMHKDLPPGIAKNLQRGKPLPPGIAKQTLPHGLLRELPPAPKGYDRIIVAGKVLLVELATQIVRDVIYDAVMS